MSSKRDILEPVVMSRESISIGRMMIGTMFRISIISFSF